MRTGPKSVENKPLLLLANDPIYLSVRPGNEGYCVQQSLMELIPMQVTPELLSYKHFPIAWASAFSAELTILIYLKSYKKFNFLLSLLLLKLSNWL